MRFTSGTTGKSKGVLISHQSVIERIEAGQQRPRTGLPRYGGMGAPDGLSFRGIGGALCALVRPSPSPAISSPAKNIIDITNQYGGTPLYASPVQIRLLANDASDHRCPV